MECINLYVNIFFFHFLLKFCIVTDICFDNIFSSFFFFFLNELNINAGQCPHVFSLQKVQNFNYYLHDTIFFFPPINRKGLEIQIHTNLIKDIISGIKSEILLTILSLYN